jgi:hypothetical protein
MKKHLDAQDLYEKSNPALEQKTTFQKAYPEVEHLALEVTADPMGFGQSHKYHYSLQHPPENFSPCPNPNCSGGGFELGRLLHNLISCKKEFGEDSGPCVGRERLARGSRTCYYMFEAKAHLKYEPEENK